MNRYKKVKLPDGSTSDEHRIVWEERNGIIPEGLVIHHKNGNGKDNRIENLELMSRSEHGRLHSIGKVYRHTWVHGTSCGYDDHKCRCDDCKRSHNARLQTWRLKKKAKENAMRKLNSRGEFTTIAAVVTLILVFIGGGITAVANLLSEPTAIAQPETPAPGIENVVHTGAITAVNHRITSGMGQDVTEIEFAGGVSYTVVGYHNVAPGEMCQIIRTPAGYDLQLK